MQIASLLPSATEIICSLGLRDQLVGISHSCDFPAGIEDLPVLTNTSVPVNASSAEIDQWVRRHLGNSASLYQIDLRALELAAPNLVVSQRLCDVCAVSSKEVDEALDNISSQPRLIDLNPGCLSDVFVDIYTVAKAAGVAETGREVVSHLQNRVARVEQLSNSIETHLRPRVAMLEWLDPPFSSGHWNPELVEIAGAIDCLGPKGEASRTIQWQDVIDSDPDVLVLSCCGFDIDRTRSEMTDLQTRPEWQQLENHVGGNIWLTDGNAYFSRPGPRLVDALEALAHTLHPNIHPRSDVAVFKHLNQVQ